ncbi:MAG: DUF3333 domain-containing protein, partial [Paracoccus sp. (in: a-proteobacteria)]|nr:DUF3333 domain-containing protein [Paracoccus sp. (in: a-proteobacteria)]
MSDVAANTPIQPRGGSLLTVDPRTRKRNAAEKRFRIYGIIAIGLAMAALVALLVSIIGNGSSAFRQTYLSMPVTISAEVVDPKGNRDLEEMKKVTTIAYGRLLSASLAQELADNGINPEGMTKKDVNGMISGEAAAQLRNRVLDDPELVGQTVEVNVLTNGRIDGYYKGRVTMESAARDSNT